MAPPRRFQPPARGQRPSPRRAPRRNRNSASRRRRRSPPEAWHTGAATPRPRARRFLLRNQALFCPLTHELPWHANQSRPARCDPGDVKDDVNGRVLIAPSAYVPESTVTLSLCVCARAKQAAETLTLRAAVSEYHLPSPTPSSPQTKSASRPGPTAGCAPAQREPRVMLLSMGSILVYEEC